MSGLPAGRPTTPWKLVLEGRPGDEQWVSSLDESNTCHWAFAILAGMGLETSLARTVCSRRGGAQGVTFTFAFDGTHSPPKAAGANLQLLCRLLDLGVSSLAPSSASASLQLPAPGAHRGGGRALPSRASSSRVHRALHDGLACSAARSNHRSLG